MAKTEPLKISELTAVTTAKNAGVIPIVQDDVTSKITFANLTKDLAKKSDLNGLEKTADLTTKLNLKADKTELTPLMKTTDADAKFAPKTELGNYLLKADATSTYALKTASYTKAESDAKYATKAQMTAIEGRLTALETPETP